MLIKDLLKNKDGTFTFDFQVTEEEVAFLVDYAVRDLVSLGALKADEKFLNVEQDLFADIEGGLQ